MNIKDWYMLPVIVSIVLVSASLFIADFNIENTDVSNFLDSSAELRERAEASRLIMEEKTSAKGLQGFIENIPVFGEMVKAGKFVASIGGTIRTGFDVFIGFFKDMLFLNILGIPSSIMGLGLVMLVGSIGFALYKAIRGTD